MRIVVCVKEVPASMEEVALENGEIDEERLTYEMNEWDEYALEAGVRIAKAHDGEVTVVTIGDEDSEDTLYQALAKDADAGIRIDEETADWDTYAKAQVLAAAVEELEDQPDLVLTGLQSDDTQNAQAGGMLAESLGIPFTNYVTEVEIESESYVAMVRRELEGGLSERREIELPAVLGIQTGMNDPRYASVRMIRRAQKKPLDVYRSDELGVDDPAANSRTVVRKLYEAPSGEMATTFDGAPEEEAEQLANKLTELGLTG